MTTDRRPHAVALARGDDVVVVQQPVEQADGSAALGAGSGASRRTVPGVRGVGTFIERGSTRTVACTGQLASDWTGSSLSIPVPVQGEVMAALNVHSTSQNAFDQDSVERASTPSSTPRPALGENAPGRGAGAGGRGSSSTRCCPAP